MGYDIILISKYLCLCGYYYYYYYYYFFYFLFLFLTLSDPMSDLVQHYDFPVPGAFLDL
jgi:hypothetical protein